MKVRIIASAAAIAAWVLVDWLLNKAAPIVSAGLATAQFDNSTAGYARGEAARWFNGSGMPTLGLIAILALIWWRPLRKAFAPVALLTLLAAPAFAYYEKTDYTEPYFVLPNESAFFIPDVGANKDSQAKFGSQQYLEENKIAAKRFIIPHTKLSGSGLWSDFYVPAGRLIIVDRTPYNQEWTAAAHRGTSAKDESFPCQSSEGINITVEIGIAASVHEESAALFLYHFGVNPPQGDRTQPQVIFTSVFQGRSLQQVMGTVGRGKVQALVCNEIAARTTDTANVETNKIMASVEAKATAWLASVGITLDYIGWAGTFTFDPTVQKAINDRYEAEKIAPVLTTLQAAADLKVKEGLGTGLAAHGLPANLVAIPSSLMDLSALANSLSGGPPKPAKP
jgi:SPFH domain/Band 7 family protein